MSAEEPIVSRLDNAGTLLQSATSNVPSEKISIVSLVHPAAHSVGYVRQSPTDKTQLPGHEPDYSACTFCLTHEDHTLGNALRWIIMKDPEVEFCGYSAPHPADPKIHLRIQMYDNQSAVDCLRRGLKNLRDLLNTVNTKYSDSLANDNFIRENDVDVKDVVAETLRSRGLGGEEDVQMA